MKLAHEPIYLGDGVYASKDSWEYILLQSEKNKIYLDVHLRRTLYKILKDEFEKAVSDGNEII